MRTILASVLFGVVGCSGGAAADKPEASDPPKDLALPVVADGQHVMVVEHGHPGAIVWVGATGKLEVGKVGPTWAGEIDSADRIAVADVEQLAATVRQAIIAGAGPQASTAKLDDAILDPTNTDPYTARQRAIQQARNAGILGDPDGLVTYGRLASAQSTPLDSIAKTAPLVIAGPNAPAVAVARAVRRAGGLLGVSHHGKLAVLDVGFSPSPTTTSDAVFEGNGGWIEVSTDTAHAIHFVLRPSGDETVALATDRDKLRAAFAQLADSTTKDLPVDVVAFDDTTAQALVDTALALESIDVRAWKLADGPHSAADRQTQIASGLGMTRSLVPSVAIGQPNAQGDLDKAIIRRYVKRNIQKVKFCYEKALLQKPTLAGTVSTQFFIAPTGVVASSIATGVDPAVSACISAVIKTIEFPKPKGGGGVQVNYPFTFRPAGP